MSLRRSCIKDYFTKITKNGNVTNKNVWKTKKPFLTNKRNLENPEIMLQHKGNIVLDESVLAKIFNKHYVNIVERSCGKKPTNISQEYDDMSDTEAIHLICKTFENHQSIKEIRRNLIESAPPAQSKTQAFVSSEHVKKLLKNIDQKKSAGIDKIPPNLLQLSADILSTPLSNAINNSILKGKFPDDAKVASVFPLDKHTDNKYSVSNFRPVSVLNIFSKMYEKVLKNMLVEKMNDHFSPFVAAYRENYNTQHVLIRLLEEWRL